MLANIFSNFKAFVHYISTSLIFLSLLFSAKSALSQEKIVNALSDEHVYINETRISVIPPKEAQLSNGFLGFYLYKGEGSIAVNLVPSAFSDFIKLDYEEKLKAVGYELISSKEYLINNLPARLVFSKGFFNGFPTFLYQLMLGTPKETVVIAARYTQDKPELGDILKRSILSVVYEANKQVNHNNVLQFKVSTEGTRFKLAKTTPTGIIYSTDGKYPSASRLHPMFLITQGSMPSIFADKKQFFIDYQKRLTMKIDQTVFLNEVSINGLNGFEAYYKGKSKAKNESESNYIIFLFTSSNNFYMIQGLTIDNTTKTLEEFKKLARSFERF